MGNFKNKRQETIQVKNYKKCAPMHSSLYFGLNAGVNH